MNPPEIHHYEENDSCIGKENVLKTWRRSNSGNSKAGTETLLKINKIQHEGAQAWNTIHGEPDNSAPHISWDDSNSPLLKTKKK